MNANMKLALLCVFGLLAVASASCPNQCSGHGRCGTNDYCTCYQQTGTTWGARVGWTGADCSLRTCPLARAWDQISTQENTVFPSLYEPAASGVSSLKVIKDATYNSAQDSIFLVKITEVTEAATDVIKFKWKYDTDDEYSTEITFTYSPYTAYELGNHTGVRVYLSPEDQISGAVCDEDDDDAYDDLCTPRNIGTVTDVDDKYTITATHNEGIDWVAVDDNTAHQYQECAARGICDRKTGQCDCFVGYTGEACARTVCPNDCNGHGICQDLRRFADDASATYNEAWDANAHMGCLCDGGYRGPDCSLIECPSGADPLGADGGAEGRDCSGRGVCDYTTGQCQCFRGYFGERCETQTNYV